MPKAGGSHTRKSREKHFPGESSVLKKHQECNSHDLAAVTSYNGEVSLPDTHLQTVVSIQDAIHSPAATSSGTCSSSPLQGGCRPVYTQIQLLVSEEKVSGMLSLWSQL